MLTCRKHAAPTAKPSGKETTGDSSNGLHQRNRPSRHHQRTHTPILPGLRNDTPTAPRMTESAPSQSSAVLFQVVEPHIALVTINRPEARNAVNGAVAAGLESAVERIENDPDLWAAILTGAGPHAFCAGADLKEVSAGRGATLSTPKGGFAGFVRAPRTRLWIAAAQGHALAGGLELLLSCDLAVAAETATFGLPEVKRSLVAGAGGLFRLPRAIPKAIALEMIASGDAISATRAGQFGLINEVVPASEVLQSARALARRVTVNAPISVRESLGVARQANDRTEAELWDISAAAGRRVWATEDFQEGPRAFVEKRPPRWVGR
jgi:enoyl-CoA hydratase/carnithine racemase